MRSQTTSFTRRRWLKNTALTTAAIAAPAWSQPGKPLPMARALTVAQLVDFSPAQQDVSKDFLIGSRAAWQDINLRGGVRGRKVVHIAVETNGTLEGLRTAIDTVKDDLSCVALSGCAGDELATQVPALARKTGLAIAHTSPWLQNSGIEIDDNTFPIFAARQAQIVHALKNLSVMGLKELGAVYATPRDHAAYHQEVERIAADLQLRLAAFRGNGDLRQMSKKMGSNSPSVMLFIGGTPELAEFTQGLENQARQRYIVGLSDVNLQSLMQMGTARGTPVIATQPVPMTNSALPIVRQYREVMARLFDEPPTPLSLAGFIAARYTFEVLNTIDAPLTRQSALAGFQQRAAMNIGGFSVSFDRQRKSGTFVTQSMMALDGRLVG